MAIDEGFAHRLREVLSERSDVDEKKMFGGLAFMVGGNMCVGIGPMGMIARVGPDQYNEALAKPGASVMDFTGKVMKGWITVDPDSVDEDDILEDWVNMALRFVETLPVK